MSFSYDLTTEIGKLRLLLQDIDATNPIFSDEELGVFLSFGEHDLYLSASEAWLALAGNYAKLAKRKSISKYSHDLSQIANECREQATYYKEKAELAPADDFAAVTLSDFQRREMYF